MMSDEVLAVVEASAIRRWIGIGLLAALGVLVIYVAFAQPPSAGWQIFLLVMGTAALWLAERMRRATAGRVELTRAGLRTRDGGVIAAVDDIVSVDRGAFAFKPSNGFLVSTSIPAPRRWEPGLWWRAGRRIGIGGVTPGAQTKFMAEMLSAMIEERRP